MSLSIGVVKMVRSDLAASGVTIITHRFGLDELETAYEVFVNAAQTGALKVLLTAPR